MNASEVWLGALVLAQGSLACTSGSLEASAGTGGGGAGGSGGAASTAAGSGGSGAAGQAGQAGASAGSAGSMTHRAGSGSAGIGGAGATDAGRAGYASTAGNAGHNGAAGSGGGIAGAGAGGMSAAAGAGAGSEAFFGASRCAAADVWLCEDFESGEIDSTRWQKMLSLPKVDGTHAARGSKALHVTTNATGGSGITTKSIFPTPDENYWGRLFVYFDALPTSPTWAHWTIVGANPTDDSAISGEIRVGGQLDMKINRFGVGTDRGPTGDWTNLDKDPDNTPSAVPLQTWICVEWQHDGAHDRTRFFWDGVEHPSLGTTRDTAHGANSSVKYDLPTLGSVWFGFWNYDQGKSNVAPASYDTWLDEIALDGERIGCER